MVDVETNGTDGRRKGYARCSNRRGNCARITAGLGRKTKT
ncbi:hypothetical protein BIFDEN_02242 [Bifidobacterium dentium ATCC 27678]|nr:hypothetical protein BIFDEN_02242 [Bifidobacterium dentium ATCC 27678]